VIGGLICATIATLVFVPVVFSIVHRKARGSGAASQPTPPPSADPIFFKETLSMQNETSLVVGQEDAPRAHRAA
jgi:hypothetical protein